MAATPTDGSGARAEVRTLRVLIADEDHEALDALASLLRDLGHEVLRNAVTRGTVQGAIEVAMRRHDEMQALDERVSQLETALERRAIIERAKGILMERLGLDDAEAFELAALQGARIEPQGGRPGARCRRRSRPVAGRLNPVSAGLLREHMWHTSRP